jgi:hypothetical protein
VQVDPAANPIDPATQGPGWWQAADGKWYPPQGGGGYATMSPPPWVYGQPTAAGATASLVFGILSFVICPIIGPILALVLGFGAKSKIRESGGQLGGGGMATAGIVLGAVGLAVPVLAVLAILAITFVGTTASTKFVTVRSSLSMIRLIVGR